MLPNRLAVTAQVCALLSIPADPSPPEIVEAVGLVWQMAQAWTRGHGFTYPNQSDSPMNECNRDIASVIVASAARLVANPVQLRHSLGDVTFNQGFAGFSLHEQVILNRYRKRVM